MMRESKKGPCKGALFLLGKVGLLKLLSLFLRKTNIGIISHLWEKYHIWNILRDYWDNAENIYKNILTKQISSAIMRSRNMKPISQAKGDF